MAGRYRLQAGLGVALLALVDIVLAVMGFPGRLTFPVVQMALLGVAGALFVLAGADTTFDYALVALTTLGGLSLALIGFNYLRGGRWFDVPTA